VSSHAELSSPTISSRKKLLQLSYKILPFSGCIGLYDSLLILQILRTYLRILMEHRPMLIQTLYPIFSNVVPEFLMEHFFQSGKHFYGLAKFYFHIYFFLSYPKSSRGRIIFWKWRQQRRRREEEELFGKEARRRTIEETWKGTRKENKGPFQEVQNTVVYRQFFQEAVVTRIRINDYALIRISRFLVKQTPISCFVFVRMAIEVKR